MASDPPDAAALARLLAELPTAYRWEGSPSGVTNWPPGPQPDVLIEFQGLSNNEAYACLLAEAANALPGLLARLAAAEAVAARAAALRAAEQARDRGRDFGVATPADYAVADAQDDVDRALVAYDALATQPAVAGAKP